MVVTALDVRARSARALAESPARGPLHQVSAQSAPSARRAVTSRAVNDLAVNVLEANDLHAVHEVTTRRGPRALRVHRGLNAQLALRVPIDRVALAVPIAPTVLSSHP
jgi:hypothetical protein